MHERQANIRRSSGSIGYRLLRVVLPDKRVTTISIGPMLYDEAVLAFGGIRAVGQLVRQFAGAYDPISAASRSAFVAEGLRVQLRALPSASQDISSTEMKAHDSCEQS